MRVGSVVITGASSGIGEGLAFEFAKRGYGLGLVARNIDKLTQIKNKINHLFPAIQVEVLELDVMRYDNVFRVMKDLDDRLKNSVEIVVANSGIAGSRVVGSGGFDENRKLIETNLIGAIATIEAGVSILKKRKKGMVAGISSVAGFRGFSGSAAYCASKSGLSTYLEAIRGEVRRHELDVIAIHPGFICTPMTGGKKSRPFEISVEKGAKLMVDAIENKKKTAIIPKFPWIFIGFFMRNLPSFIWSRVSSK